MASGRRSAARRLREMAVPLKKLPQLLDGVTRVPGTAVFLVMSRASYQPRCCAPRAQSRWHTSDCLSQHGVRTHTAPDRAIAYASNPADGVHLVTARFGLRNARRRRGAEALPVRGLKLFSQDCSFFLGGIWSPAAARRLPGISPAHVTRDAAAQHAGAEFSRMPEEARDRVSDPGRALKCPIIAALADNA